MTIAKFAVPVCNRLSMRLAGALSSACARSIKSSFPSRMYMAPAPTGAPIHLCKFSPTKSASRSCTDSGTCPNECAASTTTSTSRLRAMATMSFTGMINPVLLLQCVSNNKRVRGLASSAVVYAARIPSRVAGSGILSRATLAPRRAANAFMAHCIAL